MWRRFSAWLSRNFGVVPADAGPETLVVVHEGSPGECEIVALRLKSEGLFVSPDPMPSYSGFGRGSAFRTAPRREFAYPATAVAVLATDEARARAILDAVEPI